MRCLLRLLLIAAACFCLSHCASKAAAPQTPAPKVEWYVAARDPLTYCPKGHVLPRTGTRRNAGDGYVYLADHSARFYIPRGCLAHRKQALELRTQSKSIIRRSGETAATVISSLLSLTLFTASGLAR